MAMARLARGGAVLSTRMASRRTLFQSRTTSARGPGPARAGWRGLVHPDGVQEDVVPVEDDVGAGRTRGDGQQQTPGNKELLACHDCPPGAPRPTQPSR